MAKVCDIIRGIALVAAAVLSVKTGVEEYQQRDSKDSKVVSGVKAATKAGQDFANCFSALKRL